MAETTDAVQKQSTETRIVEYDEVAATLAKLRQRLANVAYDLRTVKGNDEARADRFACVKLRTSLEALRKRIKEPALRHSQLIDSEARRINAEIAKVEMPIDDQIRADEERREEERERKAAAETARVAAIWSMIDDITDVAINAIGKPAADIERRIALVARQKIGEQYQELQPEAEGAQADTLVRLRVMLATQLEHDAKAQKLEAERQLRLADERAEQERIEAEQKAERDRLAAQQAEFEQQQAVAEVERCRVDTHRSNIADIRERALMAASQPAQRVLQVIEEIEAIVVDAGAFEEFAAEAAHAKASALALLKSALEAAEIHEAEARALSERLTAIKQQEAEAAERRRQEDTQREQARLVELREEGRLRDAAPKLLKALQGVVYAYRVYGPIADGVGNEEVEKAMAAACTAIDEAVGVVDASFAEVPGVPT